MKKSYLFLGILLILCVLVWFFVLAGDPLAGGLRSWFNLSLKSLRFVSFKPVLMVLSIFFPLALSIHYLMKHASKEIQLSIQNVLKYLLIGIGIEIFLSALLTASCSDWECLGAGAFVFMSWGYFFFVVILTWVVTFFVRTFKKRRE